MSGRGDPGSGPGQADLERWAERAAWTVGALLGCLLIAVFAAGYALGKVW